MIHYTLRCADEHGFDGWFKDSAAFDDQVRRGLVSCPECGSASVRRALMTPSLGRKGARPEAAVVDESGAPVPQPPKPAPDKVLAAMPDQLRAALQRLRAEVEKHCDDVGDAFASEARRIHAGDSAPRSIYGNATAEEAESLAEEGIAVARLPWVPRADG